MSGDDSTLSKRQKKRLAQESKRKHQARRKRGRVVAISAAAILAAAIVVFLALRLLNRPGEPVESLGTDHVPAGVDVSYNSNPPTSGPHAGRSADAGIYEQAPDDRFLIHSLEHGYVIISYNCSLSASPCEGLKEQIEAVARDKELWKLIVTPRESLDVPIALTAWTRIDKLEAFDRGRIERFVDAWRDRGPEPTPN